MKDGSITYEHTQMYEDFLRFLEHYNPLAGTCAEISYKVHFLEEGETEEEGLQKCADAWCDFVFGRGWVSATESRWLNVTQNAKRCVLIVKDLGAALQNLAATEGLTADMVDKLVASIAEKKDDIASRNKLTLLRSAASFSSTAMQAEMATYIKVVATVDQVLYALLGNANKMGITMLELVSQEHSPIGKALNTLANLLCHWGPEAEEWNLIRTLGIDFNDIDVRRTARNQILGLRVGLLDHFELRLTKAPYSIVASRDDATVSAAVRIVFSTPLLCLPLSCQRLKARYPTQMSFKRNAPAKLERLLSRVFAHISFGERLHAQMRQDLLSSGGSRNFVGSVHRVQCKQALAHHVARGGCNPTNASVIKAVATKAMAQCSSRASGPAMLEDVPKAKPMKAALKPYIQYKKARQEAFKQAVAPDRKLTLAERKKMDSRIASGWKIVKSTPGEVERFVAAARADALKRNEPQPKASVESTTLALASAPAGFKPLWSTDDSVDCLHVVAPRAIAAHAKQLGPVYQRDLLLQDEKSHIVGSEAPQHLLRGGWGKGVLGCGEGRQICRRHGVLSGLTLVHVESFSKLLTAWAATCKTATEDRFAWLHCHGAAEADPTRADMLVKYQDQRYTPERMQYWVVCVMQDGARYFTTLPVCPFHFQLAVEPSRMCPDKQAPSACTTDELAMECWEQSKGQGLWQLFQVDAEEVIDNSLRTFEAKGHAAQFLIPAPTRRERAARDHAHDADIWDLGGAWSGSVAAGTIAGGVEESAAGTSRETGPPPAAPADEDVALLEDLQIDQVLDILDDDDGVLSDLASLFGDFDASSEEDEDAKSVQKEGEKAIVNLLDGGEDDDEEAGEEGTKQLEISDFVTATIITACGHILCSLPPWKDLPRVGHVKFFPIEAPEAEQKMSITCKIPGHTKCAFIIGRRYMSQNEALAWLYSGRATYNRDEQDRVMEEHRELWEEFKGRAAQRFKASALAGTPASSSTG